MKKNICDWMVEINYCEFIKKKIKKKIVKNGQTY